jgi:glycosyltransferase involved in cell wall biosynthesis
MDTLDRGGPPRFSIIIPAYNAGAYVGQTVSSVRAQTETDWELIVVDDGSTDATAQVVDNFGDCRIILIRQINQGVSAARNTGFAASQGEYVIFLDADDILYPNTLRRLGQELDQHPEAVLSFGSCTRFEAVCPPESLAREPVRLRKKPCGDALASLLTWNPLLMGAVLIRRHAIAAVGPFDSSLSWGEDWVFWCDLATLGPFRYLGRNPVFGYRCHRHSATRVQSIDLEGLRPAIDKVFARDAVKQRFSEKQQTRLRRRAEAFALSIVTHELLRRRNWRQASEAIWGILKRDPIGLFRDGISFVLDETLNAWR